MRRVLFLALMWPLGCMPDESLTTQQMVERTRQAAPRCDAGDAGQCRVACKYGGPNVSCKRACEGGDGGACIRLGARLERGVDAPDAETLPTPLSVAPDDEEITAVYERACELKVGQGCRLASARILNGQGRGKRSPAVVTTMLRAGCERYNDAESCCMMAHINFRLSQGRPAVDTGVNFRAEGHKWVRLASDRGGDCPLPPGITPP